MSERTRIRPAEHWRTRLIRSLLYGRNVDRNVKARARVGFAILAFAAIYSVIGGRLVMFAIGADGHSSARRAAAQDAIAVLRAEWARLDAPLRLQGLSDRHLALKPVTAQQYDQLKNLPERPPRMFRPGKPDPIGAMLNTIEAASDPDTVTGSVPQPEDKR